MGDVKKKKGLKTVLPAAAASVSPATAAAVVAMKLAKKSTGKEKTQVKEGRDSE